jgi:hypothetical protein
MITLGDKVKDKVTGFTGIAVARTEWLNGCVRISVQPEGVTKEGATFKIEAFDLEQLEVTKPAKAAIAPKKTGGPMPDVSRGQEI